VQEDLDSLEASLNDFAPEARRNALEEIAALVREGKILVKNLAGGVNVHLHTFFSFNYKDYSPSRIVWEAKKAGLDAVGSVDFDVLDAMDEMFEAGEALDVRTVVAMETRVFSPEYPEWEFSSPGEPGILYFMGTGFTRLPAPGSKAAAALAAMRRTARERNVAMLDRLRPVLAPLEIDYQRDVLPLTPSGNATERHMLAAFDLKARERFRDPAPLAAYWAERMATTPGQIAPLLGDAAKFRTAVRSKLMKKGGVGYVQPDGKTFPSIREVTDVILACDAIPCATWLDGTSDGEADPDRLLDYFLGLDCQILNIIPDRNWNIADPKTKALKTAKLGEIVAAAKRRQLPFSVGTEMNNYGQKFVDTFDAPELAPYAADFRDGAYVLYGHTLLQRALGQGMVSEWARSEFGRDRAKANAFYLEVGRRGFPPSAARVALSRLPRDCDAKAIKKALEHTQLATECAKLDPREEQAEADVGLSEDRKKWPEY